MKPKNSKRSEESYQKATDLLQKVWWFTFFLVIAPLATGFAGYWIFYLFRQGVFIALSFSVIIYMFALLFFYKAFDKYRNNPFFLNKRNNLLARIHIIYLITILALIVTPIFVFISPADSFTLLPLISFSVLYNIVYYYYRVQPIGYFNKAEGEFKHASNFQQIVKQPYNLIIFINYFAHLIFLSLTFFTDLSWFFALITNLAFYLITFITTRKISIEINKSIKEDKPLLQDLTKFKQRFVISTTSLIFFLLIQMPFVIMSLSGEQYTILQLMNGSFLSIIFALIYFKSLFYINYFYNSLLNIYKGSTRSEDSEEETPSQGIKYQKYNTVLSGVLIGSITIFCFLINILEFYWIVVVILPFFFIFAYYEQKAKMCPKNYNKYIILLISTSILIAISFGLFSGILLNIQFIIFLISLFFSLQVLVKTKYFVKENIIIFQNFLAIASFTIIAYSLFGYTKFDTLVIFHLAQVFTKDPLTIFISNILLHGILISSVSLVSFYLLYARLFSIGRSKLFRISVFAHIFLIELFIFILFNLNVFSMFERITAVRLLILSSLLFPSVFIFFIFANYLLGILSRKNFTVLTYFFLWVLIADIFLVVIVVSLLNAVILTLDFIFLSIFSQLNLKLGLHVGKVKDSSFERYLKINSYILTLEFFILFFFSFYSILPIDLVLHYRIVSSSYFSLIIMTFLINILSRSSRVFSTSVAFKINLIFSIFSAGLAFYFSFLYTLGTFYVFLIPFLSLFSILFFPIYYLLRMKRNENLTRKILVIDCILMAIFLTLIPSIISLDLVFRFGEFVDVISVLNYTFYITFSLLVFIYFLVKHYKMKDIYKLGILKSQVLIGILLAGTTVFYYPFILLSGMMYSFLIPFLVASCFLYLPMLFSYKKQLFNVNFIKNSIFVNSILLSGLIVLIPTIVGLELLRLGLSFDFFIIVVITLLLLFVVLKFIDFICMKFKILEKIIKHLKLLETLTWSSFSFSIAFGIFPYLLTELSFSITIFIFFILNIYTLRLISNYSKELKISEQLRESIVYGIVFSSSYLLVSLVQITDILSFLPSGLTFLNILWYFGLFFLFSLLLMRSKIIKPGFELLRNWLELISWFLFKILICLFISLAFPLSILTQITIFILLFSILTPVSLAYLKNLKILSEETQFFTKKVLLAIFIFSNLSLYLEIFNILTSDIASFNIFNFLPLMVIIANVILYLYFCFLRYNSIIENYSATRLISFYISSFYLLVSLFFMYFPIPIFSFFTLILILSRRSKINIFRFLAYLLLGYVLFIVITAYPSGGFIYMNSLDLNLLGYYSQIYLLVFSIVLLFSIWLNHKRNNILEKVTLYSTFSLLSFIVLFSYTLIPLIYNITISLFLFLLLIGIYFYRLKNVLYKWFIKPCVLLAVFDLVSSISYFLLFNRPPYVELNSILTFTLTLGITGFIFTLLFNNAPANFRKKSFYSVLFAIIVCIPLFLYLFIVSSFSIPFEDPIPIIFSINMGVFLFYLCIGIYQRRISWAIWKSGWYAWNILPIVNFIVIYKSLSGVDVLTNSLSLFGAYEFTGSSILSIIICSLFFLPVIYTKIKKYFLKLVFIVWGESLFLLYWISQNLFLSDIWLTNLLFVFFAVLLLMPILIGLKYWKIVSVFWMALIAINASFLFFYLVSIGIAIEVTISIVILIIGLLMIIYSFFPNVRSFGIILIISYFIVLTGIFITVYFIVLSVVQNYIFSVNISLIVVGFSLFSSKSVKLSHRIIDLCLSWILIFNFAWLTFSTFSFDPRLVPFAFFLALTVLGCSFFIFNKIKLKFHINRAIPLFVVAIGVSSSITSLFSVFLGASPYILISIFSGIFLIFLYFIIIEYRYFLWSLIPIPLALPLFELLLSIEVIRSMWILAFLTFSITYITFFQVIFNIFKNNERDDSKEMESERDDTLEMKNSMNKIFQDKNQIKLVNFTSFILNSLFISLFISILVPILQGQFLFNQIIFIYQIMDFLIIWPIFILFSLKYIEKSDIKIKLKDPLLYFNKICLVIYLLIPTAMTINLLLLMNYANVNFILIFYSITLIFSGVIFLESYVLDRRFFFYLFNSTRDKFSFWSLSAFLNLLAFFFFTYLYLNIFLLLITISLLNQLSLYFLSHLNVSKEKISMGRLILYYILFISGSFYLSSLISNGIIIIFDVLSELTYYLLLFQNSFLILLILSLLFIKVEVRLKRAIEMILLTVFQVLLAINLMTIFSLVNFLNPFSIFLIILIESCFSFQTIKYVNFLFIEAKKPEFLTKAFSLLIILLYFEMSLLFFGLMIIFVGIIESILVSQLIFFVLTLLDIYVIKKIKNGYAQLIHTLSFFVISLMILLLLNTLAAQYQILLSLEVLLFILMQFYTKYSIFTALYQLYPNKKELIDKRRTLSTRILGLSFYTNLVLLLLQALLIFKTDLQLMFLILSLMVHFLMIIDIYGMKFIGKVSNYLRAISWIFIMAFTTSYLIWSYILYSNLLVAEMIFSFLITSIPLIIFILILEAGYLTILLNFSKYVSSNKEKIKNILILILYLDLITWPLYTATLNPFYSLNLILASIGILFVLTYIDEFIGVVNEKLLINIRKISFLVIGILLSFDIYISLGFIPSLNLFFKLSVALFTFVIFLGIIIKPFKEHSYIALAFWVAIFSLLSLIIFFASNLLNLSVTVFVITFAVYPFVFLLEELRELFNKFVDIIIKAFKKIKLLIVNFLKTIYNFIKIHFKEIWTIISASLAIFIGVLLSEIWLNYLNPFHAILLSLAIFGLLYLIIPYTQTSDPDIIFQRRILRLSIGWGSVIGLLFIVIPLVWYLFTGFISTAVVGTIILVILGRKEEREKISIKWRFYTLLSLFALLIILGVLFFIQLPTIAI